MTPAIARVVAVVVLGGWFARPSLVVLLPAILIINALIWRVQRQR